VYKFLTAEFGMKSLREKRLKISTLDDLNDPFDLLPYEMRKRHIRLAFKSLTADFVRIQGIICFSSSWKDPVIWAHYSDKHKGLCLGFEVPKRLGRRVGYVKRRLPFPEHQVMSSEPMLFTKYANWSYEKEVRCFRPLLENTKSGDLYFMDFGKELRLVEVIAGARCKVTENELRSAIEPLKGVKLTKARAGFRRFEVVENQRGFQLTGLVDRKLSQRDL
jgi:hypothetical protein